MANQVPKLGRATRNGLIFLRAKSLRAKTLSGLFSEMKLCKVIQHKSCIRKIPQKHLSIFFVDVFFCRILANWMVGLAYFDSHFAVATKVVFRRPYYFQGIQVSIAIFRGHHLPIALGGLLPKNVPGRYRLGQCRAIFG